MKQLFISVLLLCFVTASSAQDFKYSWQREKMDDRYNNRTSLIVDSIIAAKQDQMGEMMEIIIYAEEEIEKYRPESALSNIALNFIRSAAEPFIDNDDPTLSMTNFGGIRSNFPKGAIRIFDIYSTFPFDNRIVIAKIKGEYIRQMVRNFAENEKFEALGGVHLVVRDRQILEFDVDGLPLDDNKTYNLVTIDFLLNGGDGIHIADYAESLTHTNITMRDAAITYLSKLSAQGEVLVNKTEGRIIIEED